MYPIRKANKDYNLNIIDLVFNRGETHPNQVYKHSLMLACLLASVPFQWTVNIYLM